MDIATLIGIVGALALIIGSILMGSPISAFIDVPSILIVFGGTIMATLVMQRLNIVLGSFAVAKNAFLLKIDSPDKLIQEIVELALKAKKGGVLSLESEVVGNKFLNRGIRMAVDGVEPDMINASLNTEKAGVLRRHKTGQKVFKFMAATAPAMGMIGTLIGLVTMLRSLDDPAAIGPAMAIALLTTFYGAVLAFIIFGPIAEKLADRTEQERLIMQIVIDGVDGIARDSTPRVLEERLRSYLDPKIRTAAGAGSNPSEEKKAA